MNKKQILDEIDEARLDLIRWIRQPIQALAYSNKGAVIGQVNSKLMPIIEELRKEVRKHKKKVI